MAGGELIVIEEVAHAGVELQTPEQTTGKGCGVMGELSDCRGQTREEKVTN